MIKTNKIYCQSAIKLNEKDESVDLIITSPPYNANIKYDNYDDNKEILEYKKLLLQVFKECYRVLKIGGRICINISNIKFKPYQPNDNYVISILLSIGFLIRDKIVWIKKTGSNKSSTAWGSWKSPSNPVLRNSHEYIIIASKLKYKLQNKGITDLTKEEFSEWTRTEWYITPYNKKSFDHPAQFPIELPKRCIKLYSWINSIVLDPFCGTGTTCYIAKLLNRQYIGYDISKKYCKIAEKRVKNASILSYNTQDIEIVSKKIKKLSKY